VGDGVEGGGDIEVVAHISPSALALLRLPRDDGWWQFLWESSSSSSPLCVIFTRRDDRCCG